MLWEFYTTASSQITRSVNFVKAGILALIRKLRNKILKLCSLPGNRIASGTGRVVNNRMWRRRTRGHAPLFSLLTYFGDRQ